MKPLLVLTLFFVTAIAFAQDEPSVEEKCHFVADGMPFESMEELRTYLLAASNNGFKLSTRDCAANDQRELMRVMKEVISERAARRNQRQLLYQCRFGSPAECPLISR